MSGCCCHGRRRYGRGWRAGAEVGEVSGGGVKKAFIRLENPTDSAPAVPASFRAR